MKVSVGHLWVVDGEVGAFVEQVVTHVDRGRLTGVTWATLNNSNYRIFSFV